jgi:hypothetical protein
VKPSVIFEPGGAVRVRLKDPGMFTNVIAFNNFMKRFSNSKKVILDFANSPYIDHTFQENLHQLEDNFYKNGQGIETRGFERHHFFSNHPSAVRIKIRNPNFNLQQEDLNPRQKSLLMYAEQNKFDFDPLRASSIIKFSLSSFVFSRNCMFGENLVMGTIMGVKFLSADIMLKQQTGLRADSIMTTVLYVNDLQNIEIPDFKIEKEELTNKIMELQGVKDIDFEEYPLFSQKYFLVGTNEEAVRAFFNKDMIILFEQSDDVYVEANQNTLLIHGQPTLASIKELSYMIEFLGKFIKLVQKKP